MKRRRTRYSQELRPPDRSSSEDDDTPSPPARKLLKNLLEKEVNNALRDLQDDYPLSNRSKTHRAASLIPEFDPDSEECTAVQAWIRKIDQIGEIHGWDDATKSFYLQDKLRGQAKKWYNRLEDYDYTWDQWKQMLLRAFPRHRDYGNMLEELLQRRKLPTETMTKYYQDKIAMCFRCKLSDNASISCIIRGLPSSLQPNARAFQCQTPEELYEGFLCALDEYRVQPIETRFQKNSVVRLQPTTDKKFIAANPETDPCPRCKKTGHLLRDCSQPDTRTCYKCGAKGHISLRCPTNIRASTSSENSVKEVNILRPYNDVYKKVVKVNGVHVKAYIDTGSQVNVLNCKVSTALSLDAKPTTVVLKGFSGGLSTSLGEVEFELVIDGITMKCQAHLSNVQMNEVNLLIGQPVINSEGMTLTVSQGAAVLRYTPDPIFESEAIEENDRFEIVTVNEERLPPGASIIQVQVLGNQKTNNVVTPPRHYELQGVSFSFPATLLRGEGGYIKVVNTGSNIIVWPPGEVLTRASSCEEPEPYSQVFHLSANSNVANSYAVSSEQAIATTSIGGVTINNIQIGPLNEKQRLELLNLLVQYEHCFAKNTSDLGCTDLVQMSIKLTNDHPVHRQPYRLSHSEQAVVKSKINELLEAGIIKESESSFASPVILVKKKNGDYRMCVDYRALNAITVKDRYPLPNIDDQVSKLAGKQFFTSLDMAQGYHQLRINPDDTHKTAFITPQGHFEYNRIPFGLANAPSVFMRLINKIVESVGRTKNLYGSGCQVVQGEILAFLDDLLLPSIDVKSGLDLLQTVLVKLESENLKLNMSKCSFLQSEVTYLGHEISAKGIQPGKSKLSAVSQFPVPNNVHSVRQFIGLCSYFRKFIPNFAVIARPLTELTKKSVSWVWQSEQEQSFEQLKQLLCSKPVLALYDPVLPTEIHTDACKLGIAGILLQKQTDGTLRPVLYFSRVTSKEESVYHSYELETLAVVESLRRFRVYIVGKHVKVVTDCTAVRATLTKRDIMPRIARWWLSIQDYDISIEYRPGERMKHVDALSRHPVDTMNINRLEVSDWFYTVQCQDEKLNAIASQLKNNIASSDIKNNYEMIDNRLYRKTLNGNRLVVPNAARWKIMQMHHDDIGHVGFNRCSDLIKNEYWFPKMTRFIKKYVAACLHCAYGKGTYGKKEGKLHPIIKPTEPMRMVHIDHVGPFCRTKKGYQYMLVMTDAFSKFVIAEPTRSVNSMETVRLLRKVFSLFSYPDHIVTDHGKAFTSRNFKKFSNDKQFRHTLNAIACPRANGQVERTNRTILNALRAVDPSEASSNWANSLPDVIWGINNTVNDTTGYKPYDLMFARAGRPVCDVSVPGRVTEPVESRRQKATARIHKTSARMKRNFDKKRKAAHVYKKGDFVLWRQAPTSSAARVNTKLDDLYSGPYVVIKVVGSDRYRIRSIKGLRGYKSFTGLVSADSLRPYKAIAPLSDSASSSDEQLETEDLIDLLES